MTTLKKKTSDPKQDIFSDEIKKIQELEDKLTQTLEDQEKLQEQLETAKQSELRALADAQNMRRRAEENRSRLIFESSKDILSAILPCLDNFDLALKNLPDEIAENEWVKGIFSIEKNMTELLSKQGVQEINQTGIPLDPNHHEVVMSDPEGKDGTVTKILQKGFLLHSKVLRPARVAVGSK